VRGDFFKNGVAVYDAAPEVCRWAEAALNLSHDALLNPELQDKWLVCQGTWFVGVDALPTGPEGQAGDVPLGGPVADDLTAYAGDVFPLHPAQLSVVYPGYPKPREGETEAAFRYRKTRDAAHVDGLHATGANRRRHLGEYHAYILGLPLNHSDRDASPLVVWQGSHRIFQDMFRDQLGDLAPKDWPSVDFTDIYQQTRKRVFDECERVEILAQPGQAVVMHRMSLHGVAPWAAGDNPLGRRIAYFRPVFPDPHSWLTTP